jgi:hypothetical protein
VPDPKRPGSVSDTEDRPKRFQSQTERDLAGIEARRDRHRSAPRGIPEFRSEEVTGQYEGEELAQARAKRPTDERIARLEQKHDSLDGMVNDMRVELGNVSGKLDVLPDLVDLIRGKSAADQARTADEHETRRLSMTTRAKVVIAIVGLAGAALGIAGTALSGCT